MKPAWLILPLGLILLAASACGNPNPEGDLSSRPSPPVGTPMPVTARTGTFFAIDEVGLGPEGFVALTNFTQVPASLSGLYLCQGSQCFALPEVAVGAGETARIGIGEGAGIQNLVASHADLSELRPSDGEVALYASPDTGDPDQMLAYLQWGSTPHALTQVAIQAGLWVEGGYAPSSPRATRLFKVRETGLWLFEEP